MRRVAMKIIDYDKLLCAHKRSGYITTDANIIANQLIKDLNIQGGFGLARFLEVDVCFDNYRAVRIWVQRQLDKQPNYLINEMRNQLECELSCLITD